MANGREQEHRTTNNSFLTQTTAVRVLPELLMLAMRQTYCKILQTNILKSTNLPAGLSLAADLAVRWVLTLDTHATFPFKSFVP